MTVSRRRFLRITATAGALVGLGALRVAQHTAAVSQTRLLMGTTATLTLISRDRRSAEAAITATFARMRGLEAVFTRFHPGSQLARLNAHGWLPDPHPALLEVISRARHFSEMTGGLFDVTIEPLLALYRRAGPWPTPAEVASAHALIGCRSISVERGAIRLMQPGMALTLDGIAKGYIIDQGAATLSGRGFGDVLVEVGGDLRAHGQHGRRDWRVGIQSPDVGSAWASVDLSEAAMATSGDYANAFTPDRDHHHILDPATGRSPSELSSATVIAPTACDADALSTAVLAMGAEKGLALIEGLPGTEAYLITKGRRAKASSGFRLG